jgi:S1-C subfamily serine protease
MSDSQSSGGFPPVASPPQQAAQPASPSALPPLQPPPYAAPHAGQPMLPPPGPLPMAQPIMAGPMPMQPMMPPPEEHFDSRATQQAQRRASQPSMPPTASSIPPPNPPPRRASNGRRGTKIAMIGGLVVALLGLVVGGVFVARRFFKGDRVGDAVVRVVTPTGKGSGFFVQGPDDNAYVATAFHVIEGGERILVERNVAEGNDHYVEAYPETEVVAYDAESDLAIIRIKNVRGDRFERLTLSDQPFANESIRSYGFPGSNITRRTGLIAKDGKLLSLVKFPVLDRRNGRVVRDNAIDGLLVSTDIEPGFSGGPTVNEAGAVVGVNVQKDLAHDGQNGVVHVKVLRALLEQVKPAATRPEPSTSDVTALLARVQKDFLLLPVDDRLDAREHDLIGAGELPRLRDLIDEVRRHERDSSRTDRAKLSGRAAFGVWAAQLPGKPLETYQSPKVQEAITKCERASERMVSLFQDLAAGDDDKSGADKTKAALRACDDLALRPLAWDLLAATLQWTGGEREYTATRVERVDEEADVYRVMVRIGGVPSLVPLWVSTEYGQLRVKLFDPDGKLYGVKSAAEPASSELAGEWQLDQPRAPAPGLKDAELERHEALSVVVEGDRNVTIKHVVDEKLFATDNALFRCSGRSETETGWVQSFSGKLDHGVILAVPSTEPRRTGSDGARCSWGYQADAVVVLKLLDGKLTMYRSDGREYPQSVVLERKKDEPKKEDAK